MTTLGPSPNWTAHSHTVRCVEEKVVDGSSDHRHVTAIETIGADGRRFRWTLVQAIAAMRDGERFIVEGDSGGQATVLEPVVCRRCPQATLVGSGNAGLPTCG